MQQTEIKIATLAQLTQGDDWRLQLAHDREESLLIWITRGQGRLLLDGQRRGVGPHNAIYVPSRSLFSLELGRPSSGQAIVISSNADAVFPRAPHQFRIREAEAMSEITALIETTAREQQLARPLLETAMEAHGVLLSVWLRRQIASDAGLPDRSSAATRLSAAYSKRISAQYKEPLTMADHAAALQVTPTHLTRTCKSATGKTAADLLTERILYEARNLLMSTRIPAQDIARHLGFGSAAYFTRFIRHHTKSTPTTLRHSAV